MTYKIVGFDTTNNIASVQYADDAGGYHEPVFSIKLPVENDSLPTGPALDQYIIDNKPHAFLETIQAPAAPVNQAEILALVQQASIPDRDPFNAPWDVILSERKRLLEISDWTQIPDNPMSEEKRQAWRVFRQELRDIPQKYSTSAEVVWPEPPVPIPADAPADIHEAHYLQYAAMKYTGSIFWREKIK
jgi:hypothetical protein